MKILSSATAGVILLVFTVVRSEFSDEPTARIESQIADEVYFHLYTRNNPTTSQELIVGDVTTLANSNWNASKLTRIVTHGWMNSGESPPCTDIRDAYLENGDHNVIIVDWSIIAKQLYGVAAVQVRSVASQVALLIDFLESQGLDVSQLVVVGHSLGGHVAGISSLRAKNTVGYVVALDPNGLYFENVSPQNRVDEIDADHVQVIHTNAGHMGMAKAVGHIDFYPNGGETQDGCLLDNTGVCSHYRAFRFFAESINSERGFWGQLCRTWRIFRYGRCATSTTALMGGNVPADIPESGSYFLRTANAPNFALGPI